MVSTRPYLIRAIYDWAQDNQLTPHLLVDATFEHVVVPQEFVEDGKIILNVAGSAVADLELGNEMISFSARFSGRAQEIFIPISAVKAIYARENGVGMVLPDELESSEISEPDPPTPTPAPGSGKGGHLKIVK